MTPSIAVPAAAATAGHVGNVACMIGRFRNRLTVSRRSRTGRRAKHACGRSHHHYDRQVTHVRSLRISAETLPSNLFAVKSGRVSIHDDLKAPWNSALPAELTPASAVPRINILEAPHPDTLLICLVE